MGSPRPTAKQSPRSAAAGEQPRGAAKAQGSRTRTRASEGFVDPQLSPRHCAVFLGQQEMKQAVFSASVELTF